MTRVVWTSPARDDLREIRAYVARDSAQYARLVVERLLAAVERLQDYPLSGRIVPEVEQPTLREVVAGAYRIVYRVTASEVHILTVVHGARQFPPGER